MDGVLKDRYEYFDADDLLTTSMIHYYDGKEMFSETTVYNSFDKPVAITGYYFDDDVYTHESYSYDENGNQITYNYDYGNQSGTYQKSDYNENNKVVRVESYAKTPEGLVYESQILTEYDEHGNVTLESYDFASGYNVSYGYEYEYDDFGNILVKKYYLDNVLNSTETYTYY